MLEMVRFAEEARYVCCERRKHFGAFLRTGFARNVLIVVYKTTNIELAQSFSQPGVDQRRFALCQINASLIA